MNKKKILLVNSPNDLREKNEDWEYSLAHASLAAKLIEDGHKVKVIHFTTPYINEVIEQLKNTIIEFKPDYFGTSVLTDNRNNAKKLFATVKETNKNICNIAGGVHASFLWEHMLMDHNIDLVIIGEGEETFLDVLKTNKELKDIPGLAWRDERPGAEDFFPRNINKNEQRKRTFILDKFPIPAHELYSNVIKEKGIGYMVTGRGCVNHPGCSFCCGQAYWQGCLSQRKAENVVKEIKVLFKINPELKEIHFLDDEFLCNRPRIYKIFEMLEKENIKFKWICSARASSLDDKFIKYIVGHGCYCVHIGVESFSQKILDAAHKNVKVKQMCDAIKMCRKHKVIPALMCITGLPGETTETVNENIRIAQSIGEAIEPAITLVYPGTEVYQLALKKGQLTPKYWLTEKMAPLYTAEHNKARLLWWVYKTAILTHWKAGSLSSFIGRKFRLTRIKTLFIKFIGRKSR